MSILFTTGDHRRGLAPLNDLGDGTEGWTDIPGSVAQGAGAAALTLDAFRDTPFQLYCFRNNQNDSLSFVYQFPHGWNRGQCRPHVHVIPLADPVVAQVARFKGQYAWSRAGSGVAIPANAAWTAFQFDLTVNPGDVNTERIVNVGMITPPANIVVESMLLLLYVQRAGLDAGDTYKTNKVGGTIAANLGVLSADVHIQMEKVGTKAEIPEII